ncbi:MAG: zinc-dependent peptidase, partial [Proteobacteria bacterium]|nr:zinc-dependent peptidase [Pseudomonadota bacterium]
MDMAAGYASRAAACIGGACKPARQPQLPSESIDLPMPLLICFLVALLAAAAVALWPLWVRRRRARIAGLPFPPAWRRLLRRHVPLVARLPARHQLRLKGLMQVFLAEKPIIGCRGLRVTDEMRAALMPINRRWNIKAVLDACPTLTWKAFLYLLTTTGCRRGEILGLAWEQVHLEGAFIRLTKTKARRV